MYLFKHYKLNLLALLLLNGLVWLAVVYTPGNRLKIVFCDVGQGDAAIISFGFTQVLIDGGPDDRIIGCLGEYLPFYDRKIEAVVLTHPDADHFTGLIPASKEYQIQRFLTGPAVSDEPAYQQLLALIIGQKSGQTVLFAGDIIKLGGYRLKVIWPEKAWADETLKIAELTAKQPEFNQYSVFMVLQKLTVGNLSAGKAGWLPIAALTGDADSLVQPLFDLNRLGNMKRLAILKYPHHGSKTGMDNMFLEKLKPKEAVISVGKNTFGHPATEAIELLEKYGIEIKRTDQLGDIVYKL